MTTLPDLIPIGAAVAWDHAAANNPVLVFPWEDQDGSTRARWCDAFAAGLEAMALAADREGLADDVEETDG